MPTVAERSILLVDTSAAIPLVLEDHEGHRATVAAIGGRRLGLAGHAAFEVLSVLTRLPAPTRRSPGAVGRLLEANFPESRFLSAARATQLVHDLGRLGIGGGSVYDALVAATAAEHGLRLVTRDRRALDVYRSLDVEVEVLA